MKNSGEMKNSSSLRNPIFWDFGKNGGRCFGTSGGYFELKLTKHAHFVIFSIYTDIGEVSKKLKNVRLWSLLTVNI